MGLLLTLKSDLISMLQITYAFINEHLLLLTNSVLLWQDMPSYLVTFAHQLLV